MLTQLLYTNFIPTARPSFYQKIALIEIPTLWRPKSENFEYQAPLSCLKPADFHPFLRIYFHILCEIMRLFLRLETFHILNHPYLADTQLGKLTI
jgi:hypothetical protein